MKEKTDLNGSLILPTIGLVHKDYQAHTELIDFEGYSPSYSLVNSQSNKSVF